MNDPQLTGLLPEPVVAFLASIPQADLSTETRETYKNKYNIHFHPNRLPSLQSADPKIIKNIRSMLATVSNDNVEAKIAAVSELLEHIQLESEWLEAGKLFYINMIDNRLLFDAFIAVLLALERKYPRLIGAVHIQIYQQLMQPQNFEDTLCETGSDRTKRWMVSNGLLISKIYNTPRLSQKKSSSSSTPAQHLYSPQFVVWALHHWLGSVQPDQTLGLEVLVKVLPELKDLELPPDVRKQLQEIVLDKKYPMRLRMLLDLPCLKN